MSGKPKGNKVRSLITWPKEQRYEGTKRRLSEKRREEPGKGSVREAVKGR